MNYQKTIILSGPVLAALLASSAYAQTQSLEDQCASDTGDCIIITQVAENPILTDDDEDMPQNSAEVVVSGDQTVIMAYEDVAQSGDGNSASFDITGDQNTFIFAQAGNSLLAMVVAGNGNTVQLFELGGVEDRLAELNLAISGDANTVDVFSSRTQIVADLLDFDILGMDNVLEVQFADYASILANIVGDRNTVKINQDTGDYTTELTSVQLHLDGNDSADNLVEIIQNGVRHAVDVILNGSENEVRVRQGQENVGDNQNYMMISGDENNVDHVQEYENNSSDIDLTGSRNSLNIYQWSNSDVDLSVGGSDNSVDLNLEYGGSTEVNISGAQNRVEQRFFGSFVHSYGGFQNELTVVGDDNEVVQRDDGFESSVRNVLLEGDRNIYRFDGFTDSFGYGDMEPQVDVSIQGSDNSFEVFGFFLGQPESGVTKASINGAFNSLFMLDSLGFEVDVDGDFNSLNFNSSSSDNGVVTVAGDGNSIQLSRSEILGSLNINGSDNALTLADLAPRTINADFVGSNNVFEFADDGGISYLFAYDFDINGSNNIAEIQTFNEGTLDYVDLTGSLLVSGDRNDISIAHVPSSFSVNVEGDDNVFDVAYNADLGAYTHSISSVGSGMASFSSPNGVVSVSQHGM